MPLSPPSVTKAKDVCGLFMLGIHPEFILESRVQCFSGKLVDIWGKYQQEQEIKKRFLVFLITSFHFNSARVIKASESIMSQIVRSCIFSNLIIGYGLKRVFHPLLCWMLAGQGSFVKLLGGVANIMLEFPGCHTSFAL